MMPVAKRVDTVAVMDSKRWYRRAKWLATVRARVAVAKRGMRLRCRSANEGDTFCFMVNIEERTRHGHKLAESRNGRVENSIQ